MRDLKMPFINTLDSGLPASLAPLLQMRAFGAEGGV
jgi:hypothetical protein